MLTSEARKIRWDPGEIAIHYETKTALEFLLLKECKHVFQKKGASFGFPGASGVKGDKTIDFTAISRASKSVLTCCKTGGILVEVGGHRQFLFHLLFEYIHNSGLVLNVLERYKYSRNSRENKLWEA